MTSEKIPKTLGVLIAAITLQTGCSMLPNQVDASRSKPTVSAMASNSRVNIKIDESIDAIEQLVLILITDDEKFLAFTKNPNLFIKNDRRLSEIIPDDYGFSEFINTVTAARQVYANQKGSNSYFNEIIQIRGVTTDSFRSRGRTLEWSRQVKSQANFDPAVETKLGRESATEFNRNAISNQAFPQNRSTTYDTGLELNIEGRDFGPLIKPSIINRLLETI